MRKLIAVVTLCLLTFPALCQSTSKYQVATITEVKPHQAAGEVRLIPPAMTFPSKWATQFIVVLYTHRWAKSPRSTQAGHELLVLVGKNTITYNDMLGRSLQVPIESQRPVTEPKQSK